MQFRDLGAQYSLLKNDIDAGISEVIESSGFIGGASVTELETALADYVGVKYCLTCANGTDALELALTVWGVGEGDAVFVPDFTFFSSGEAPAALGATPVFVDVDSRTFNMDPASLDNAIRAVEAQGDLKPRVVVAVDLFGLPADYPAIRQICAEHGLLLLEDGAQGFGGEIGDKQACSFGDISTTSFFPAKPLGCYGDGGAVFTDNDEWDSLLRSYAVHGKGSMKYDNVRLGRNSRLDAIQAAILAPKLAAFDAHEVADVNERAAWYQAALADLPLVLPVVPEGYLSSWAQYTVQLPAGVDRDSLQAALKRQGVPTNVYYIKPMHEQGAFYKDGMDQKLCECPDGCPITTELCSRVLSLPMGPYLKPREVDAVAAALASVL